MYEERKFTRYLTNLAIEIPLATESTLKRLRLKDVSLGGLAFESDIPWEIGVVIVIRVLASPPFKLTGKVVRCRQNGERFDVGVKLVERKSAEHQPERYKKMLANIVETLCESW